MMQVGYVGLLKAINNPLTPVLRRPSPPTPSRAGAARSSGISGIRGGRSGVKTLRRRGTAARDQGRPMVDLAAGTGHAPADAELPGTWALPMRGELHGGPARPTCSSTPPLAGRSAQSRPTGDQARGPDRGGRPRAGTGRGCRTRSALTGTSCLSRERHILLMRFYGNLTQAEIGERASASYQMCTCRDCSGDGALGTCGTACSARTPTMPSRPPAPAAHRQQTQGDRHEDRHGFQLHRRRGRHSPRSPSPSLQAG